MCCGCVFAPLFIFWLVYALIELSRFQPLYTPLKCTSIYTYFRLDQIVHPVTGVLRVDDQKIKMECVNPNEYDVALGLKSNFELFLTAETVGMPGNRLIGAGDMKLAEKALIQNEKEIESESKRVRFAFNMKFVMNTKYLKGFTANVQHKIEGGDTSPRFPLLFTFRPEISGEGKALGIGFEEVDILPTLYCGLMLTYDMPDATNGTRGYPIPMGGIHVDTMTVCNHDPKKTLRDVSVLPIGKGPKKQVDHNHYITDLNPNEDRLHRIKNDFDVRLALVTGFFLFLAILACVLACLCLYCRFVDDEVAMKPQREPQPMIEDPEIPDEPQAAIVEATPEPEPVPVPEPEPVPVVEEPEYDEV